MRTASQEMLRMVPACSQCWFTVPVRKSVRTGDTQSGETVLAQGHMCYASVPSLENKSSAKEEGKSKNANFQSGMGSCFRITKWQDVGFRLYNPAADSDL